MFILPHILSCKETQYDTNLCTRAMKLKAYLKKPLLSLKKITEQLNYIKKEQHQFKKKEIQQTQDNNSNNNNLLLILKKKNSASSVD